MHLIDTDAGVMGSSAVVGTTIANAVGYAYSVKLRQNTVVMSFFGDGATEEGVFAESLNFAFLKITHCLRMRKQRLRDPHASDEAAGPADTCPLRRLVCRPS